MSKTHNKPYRKRKRYKMKAKASAGFSYGIGRRGRGAALAPMAPRDTTVIDIATRMLRRMGFKS